MMPVPDSFRAGIFCREIIPPTFPSARRSDRLRPMEKPILLCIGHRGAMGHEPENTLRSIRRAMELGAPCVEIDVYWVDGHLVVIHDDRLERTTNGSGRVTEQTFEYLRSLDAGKGERIPTLEEVCETIGPHIGLNVELKGPETAAPVASLISSLVQRGRKKDSFLVSSYQKEELRRVKQIDSDILLGVLCDKHFDDGLQFALEIGAFSFNPSRLTVRRPLVDKAHGYGFKVYVHAVNRLRTLEKMHAMGVDGVFTNYPERVLEHYAQGADAACWTVQKDLH